MATSKKPTNYYDVIYKTKSGRGMVAKRIAATSQVAAMKKVKSEMRASTSFKNCVMAIKLN